MSDALVRKRWVFHVPGYDPAPPEAVKQRFARELKRFEQTWSVWAEVPKRHVETPESWQVEASGPNWHTQTQYRLVAWNDVIQAAAEKPVWWRIPHGLLALLDFGTAALPGYFRANWRYALFFLYPFLLFGLLVALSVFLAGPATRLTGSVLGGVAIATAIFAWNWYWAGRRWFLNLMFDDWIFSRRYVRSGDAAVAAKLDHVANELAEVVRSNEADEIVVVGHSLGAVFAIDILDRALRIEPALGQKGPRLALITVGSSILKIGLHRAANNFRAATERVAASGIFWGDYQALSDVMNFYKSDPLTAMGLPSRAVPLVHVVRFRDMLDPAIYQRIRRHPLRLHNQFVSGNNRRHWYDYFMLVCGPLSAEQLARGDGALSAIGSDGRLLESAPV
jgi:hypothetical protein